MQHALQLNLMLQWLADREAELLPVPYFHVSAAQEIPCDTR